MLRARGLYLVAENDRFVPPEAQTLLFNQLPAQAPRTLAVLRGALCSCARLAAAGLAYVDMKPSNVLFRFEDGDALAGITHAHRVSLRSDAIVLNRRGRAAF